MEDTHLTPLLESLVNDNDAYSFPIDTIRIELFEMLLHQEELQYFIKQACRKLNLSHNRIFSTIFLTTLELVLDTKNIDPYLLSKKEYEEKIDKLTEVLENIIVTRIDKDSPDGEMMTAMQ